MKIKEMMERSIKRLKQKQIPEAVLKEKLLVSYLLGVEKEYLVVHDTQEVSEAIKKKEQQAVEQLLQRVPIQYIIHQQAFMKLPFYVNENVLIPQPDTEILVEEVIQQYQTETPPYSILDMGTGSGAIAVSIAYYLPNSKVVAVDISDKALEVAKKNAIFHKVSNQITFVQSDMFTNISEKYDSIVSNPPYIKTEVLKTLMPEVQQEPKLALEGR